MNEIEQASKMTNVTIEPRIELLESIEQNFDKAPHEILSDREFEVLKLIAEGQSISKIGETLSLSVNTISTYRTRIMEKLNIHNNADLVKYAMKHSLI